MGRRNNFPSAPTCVPEELNTFFWDTGFPLSGRGVRRGAPFQLLPALAAPAEAAEVELLPFSLSAPVAMAAAGDNPDTEDAARRPFARQACQLRTEGWGCSLLTQHARGSRVDQTIDPASLQHKAFY